MALMTWQTYLELSLLHPHYVTYFILRVSSGTSFCVGVNTLDQHLCHLTLNALVRAHASRKYSLPPIWASAPLYRWMISGYPEVVCVCILFTLTDQLIKCCLAVTGRRPSLALSHRCPCTLSLLPGPEWQPISLWQTHKLLWRPPQHPNVQTPISVTAVSNGINIKTAVFQPSVLICLSIWGLADWGRG